MRVIDSHTEGEPTRVVVDGGPHLEGSSAAQRLANLSRDHDDFRRKVILEPRGFDALVGALLYEPTRQDCATGAIFFNNAGYLGMCGHGMIGVAVTLAHLGLVEPGSLKVETPVGVVGVNLLSANEAVIENVPSYCYRSGVTLMVEGLGEVTGDIAWGGNWFFLTEQAPCTLTKEHERQLTTAASQIRFALAQAGITGADGAEIDHVEFFSEPHSQEGNSRNFVLCPGGAYDRSPCGTGTSAKLACLAEKGLLAPGEPWVQESLIGSRFIASYRTGTEKGTIIPKISGRAYVCAESTLICQPGDPFANGIGV